LARRRRSHVSRAHPGARGAGERQCPAPTRQSVFTGEGPELKHDTDCAGGAA
jgi:hypothetical protein